MECNFFSYHWTQVNGKEILQQGDCYYFTTLTNYDLQEMKDYAKRFFSIDPAAIITIQNIQPITKELFELKTGKPFFL